MSVRTTDPRQTAFVDLEVDRHVPAPPIARNSDPGTSHAGARDVTDSRRRESHCERILEVVRLYPGKTMRELATLARLEPYTVSKRLSDLHKTERIVPGVPRECTASKAKARTWYVAT